MTPETNRPEWAKGSEWEGWKYVKDWMERRTFYVKFCILDSGVLQISDIFNEVNLYLETPANALEVGEFIAEKLGGWK